MKNDFFSSRAPATLLVLILLVALCSPACTKRTDPARTAGERGRLHPALPVEGATRAPVIIWYEHRDFATTMARAKALDKPIFFKFDADWCPYCARLEETLFQDPNVRAAARDYFCVRVNGDLASADRLMAAYHVAGYPTLVFTQPDGTPLGAWQDVVDAAAFTTQLRAMADVTQPHTSWTTHLTNALPTGPLPADHYFDEIAALEAAGNAAEVQRIARLGGFDLLARLHTDADLRARQSELGSAIQLLIKGGAVAEAVALAQHAVRLFPDHFLSHHRLAFAHKAAGQWPDALASARTAFAKAYGRNRLWVADLYSEILLHEGDRDTARAVIQEALAGIDWDTNTRDKARKYKALLEARLVTLAK